MLQLTEVLKRHKLHDRRVVTWPDTPLMLSATHAGTTCQASIVLGRQLAPIPGLHKLICNRLQESLSLQKRRKKLRR